MAMDKQPASLLEQRLEFESVDNKPAPDPEIIDRVSEPAKPKPAVSAQPQVPAVQAAYQPSYDSQVSLQGWYGQLAEKMKQE